jgi:hypothetical protein
MAIGVLAVVLVLAAASVRAGHGSICGPGDHWIDTCPAFSISNETASTVAIDFDSDGVADVSLDLIGEADHVSAAPDNTDPGDLAHLNHIDIEIASFVETAGGITLTLANTAPGQITEQSGDPALADIFFDVFFEIEGTPFGTLHNTQALRVEAVIDQIPPFNVDMVGVNVPLALYDGNGVLVAQMTAAAHAVVPSSIVGGTVELVSQSDSQASASSSLPRDYAAPLAAGVTAAAIALAAVAW